MSSHLYKGPRRSARLAQLASVRGCVKTSSNRNFCSNSHIVLGDARQIGRSSCGQRDSCYVPARVHGGDYELGDIVIGQIERLGNGQFQWNRYRKSAANVMEAWVMLNAEWHSEQLQYLAVAERGNRCLRKEEFFAWRSGGVIELKHPSYNGQTFYGRCWVEFGWLVYIEDTSFIRVGVPLVDDYDSSSYGLSLIHI